MSRIRSIHPGLWTDEEFVGLSAYARLLFMGLWNECDDKGVFEWKPLTIKMRLLPADNIDVAALLEEITTAGSIRQYEVDGKPYGAVRNFCKFQRPKKPNDIHPTTAEIRAFCGTSGEPVSDGSAPVGNQFGTSGEKSPQMEDGGGRVVPFSNENGACDSDKDFWDKAKAYVGKSKSPKIGQWIRDYGQDTTAQAITAAQIARAVDPIPYIERTLRNGRTRASPSLPVC